MKYVIQKETGLGETTVVELDTTDQEAVQAAYLRLDERLWQTNGKIVEVRDFIAQIKDPNYRYLFVSFFDTLIGISSQAEPLQRKFKVDPPKDFETWLAAKGGK
jgi:hypothetical protein